MKSARILVVDEDIRVQENLQEYLQPLECTVKISGRGKDAVQLLEQDEYDILLLDLHLPDANGNELLRQILKEHPALSIIIISGHGTIDVAVEAMKYGAVDFLEKPIEQKELQDTVKALLSKKELSEDSAQSYSEYLHLAKVQLRKGKFDAAAYLAEKAIDIHAERPDAYNVKGMIFEMRGDEENARTQYRLALTHDPSYQPAIINLDRLSHKKY